MANPICIIYGNYYGAVGKWIVPTASSLKQHLKLWRMERNDAFVCGRG